MKKTEIQRIAEAAKGHGQAILDRWLPGGKRQGKEYVVRNLHRDDAHLGSLSVEIASGKGGDFATGETFGDFVGLVAFADGCGMSEAAEAVAGFLGITGAAQPPATSPAPKKKSPPTWHPVLPAPEGAPAPPKANPKRGKPSTIYTYVDAAGALLGYVWRYEARPPEFPRKDFYPLFYFTSDAGKGEWRFQSLPAPRPLYGLDRLARMPNAGVIVHEGEKAADAGQRLAPDSVNLAWPNGANAADKADFGPLGGRDVILWPDHDAPGRKAMQAAARAMKRAGARSIKLIDTTVFEKTTVNDAGRHVERLAPLPAGWDCADAEAEGWTSALLDELLRRDGVLVDTLPAPAGEEGEALGENDEAAGEGAGPYLFDAELGLYYIETDNAGRVHQVRLCGPLGVPAIARDAEGGSWGPVLEFRDRDGQRRREVIPFRLFLGEGHDGVKQLADLGLEIASGRQTLDRLKAYIVGARTERRARLVDQTGWHGRAFVFPDGSTA